MSRPCLPTASAAARFPCGQTRREFVWEMGGGFAGTALAALLAQDGFRTPARGEESAEGRAALNPLASRQPHFPVKAKSVIFLMMNGAPSQVDTFDHKPVLEKFAGQPLPEEIGAVRALARRDLFTFAEEFAAIRGISIDYAVLEHARDVAMIEAPFSWDDLGGWSAVARQRGADSDGNTVVGRHLGIGSSRTIVHAADDHLVVTMGLEDMLVVHTPDATLVARRAHEEAVRKVVAELENRGWAEFL